MSLEVQSEQKAFGGTQWVFSHNAPSLSCTMTFALFEPPQAALGPVPQVLWLSGLTCNHENFMTKAGAQRVAAELGLALVIPDTSPRGDDVPDDPEGAYDFGLGAGFYVNAAEAPYARHYRMRDYIERDLPAALALRPALDAGRVSISGHSMGGHGALTFALRSPARYSSVSAFAPIVNPTECGWGQKAFGGYLGADRSRWADYDAVRLIDAGARVPELLVDQGTADAFLDQQLRPERLEAACAAAGIDLTLRLQPGYDHSYFFIASFIEDHLRWHAARLAA
ncbi:MAG: S-formylglutathione hydrolase [Pseudomonadota bacterium]